MIRYTIPSVIWLYVGSERESHRLVNTNLDVDDGRGQKKMEVIRRTEWDWKTWPWAATESQPIIALETP